MAQRRSTAILISGRGSNMTALIEAAKTPDFPASIDLVLANRAQAAGVEAARARGIQTSVIIGRSFPDREAYDKALDESLRKSNISIICLAGFMHILSPWFVERWLGRLINIHPSLLPAYRGLRTHERALADGVRLHGCSTHFVIPALDAGPIIMQAAVPVRANDTADSLAARVLEQEHLIYPRTLALVASGVARLEDGRCVIPVLDDAAGALISPRF